jgi:hypothetical protein
VDLPSVDERFSQQREDQPGEERIAHQQSHQQLFIRFISKWTKDKEMKTIVMATHLSPSEFHCPFYPGSEGEFFS